MRRRFAVGLVGLVLAGAVFGNTAPVFEQRLGARLPASLQLRDTDGSAIALGSLLRPGRALVLLPAYYSCDTLCGTVAHGALEALADSGVPRDEWQLVLFSIDPLDTPAQAAALRDVYARYAAWSRPTEFDGGVPLRLLTGDAAQTRALSEVIGFGWRQAAASSGRPAPVIEHPAGLVVLTPDGVVSHYLFGVRFDAPTLRDALLDARRGEVGGWVERLSMICSHLGGADRDARAAWAWIRLAAAGSATGLFLLAAGVMWRRIGRRGAVDG